MFELKLLGGKKEQIATCYVYSILCTFVVRTKENLNVIKKYNHNSIGVSNLHLQMYLAALYCIPVQKLCELLVK
jgi:hypothetical protein